MDLQTIANLLISAIRSRQNLTIGEATGTIIAGGTGSFTTAFGLITATATNFCTGKCFLAKVEGKWYAIGNEQQSVVIRSSVDRLIQSRRKPVATELFLGKFIGTNQSENSPRKIIYDFDIDLDSLVAGFVPPVNPNAIAFYLDNISGEDEADLADLYWRVSSYDSFNNSDTYGADRFLSIDSAGAAIDYQIPFVQSPQIGDAVYIGNSRYVSVYGHNFTQPIAFGNPTLLRFYSPIGIENGTIVGINLPLEQPSTTSLGIYPSPVPAQTTPQARAVNGNYYRDSNFQRGIEYTNLPAGLITGETYDGDPVTGTIEVSYGNLGIDTNSKIPVAIGHKTLSRVFSNPVLKPKAVVDRRYTNWSPTLRNGTLIRARIYTDARSNVIATYDLDGLSVDLYDFEFGGEILEASGYNLVGTDTVAFAPALAVFFNGFATQKVVEQTTEFNIGVGNTVLSKTYAPAEFYARFKSAKVAIVTDRIRNCQFTDLSLNKLSADPLPEFERYEARSATYTTSNDVANPTDFRGLIFKSVEFFDPKVTNILNSADCYAKFYRLIGRNNKLYALEFWVSDDGSVNLVNIHERESLAGEPDPRFSFQSRLYYPPSESEV